MSESPFRDVAGRAKGPLDAAAWDARWVDEDTPWDLGAASPPLAGALERGLIAPPGRALVPGCGRGHDARLLTRAGFDVTGVDISASALAIARELAADEGADTGFLEADLFALPDELRDLDLVFEHTCFCAIAPELRDDYVRVVAERLRPGGVLLGVFFLIEREQGPPFGATEDELRHRFGPWFEIDHAAAPPDSHERRIGWEFLVRMTRR